MIGYPISKTKLKALIGAKSATWLTRADALTEEFRRKGKYREKSTIWSEVKEIYMDLQGESKCAYCERKLEAVAHGKAEQDVEHFRPKGNVKAWKPPASLSAKGIAFTPAPKQGRGYFLLPYNIHNYSAACKPCNSALKGDRFPIAGTYELNGEDPSVLKREKPFLICPVSDWDDDPESMIHFHGVSPQAIQKSGHKHARAIVTIAFFGLDDVNRKNLIRERASIIVALFPYLEKLADGAIGQARLVAQGIVSGFTSDRSAHANCARSFRRLFQSDRAEATAVFERTYKLFQSMS